MRINNQETRITINQETKNTINFEIPELIHLISEYFENVNDKVKLKNLSKKLMNHKLFSSLSGNLITGSSVNFNDEDKKNIKDVEFKANVLNYGEPKLNIIKGTNLDSLLINGYLYCNMKLEVHSKVDMIEINIHKPDIYYLLSKPNREKFYISIKTSTISIPTVEMKEENLYEVKYLEKPVLIIEETYSNGSISTDTIYV